MVDPLGTKGALARAYAGLLENMFAAEGPASERPDRLMTALGTLTPQFSDRQQHDCQVGVQKGRGVGGLGTGANAWRASAPLR